VSNVPLYLAEALGYYEDEGLQVNLNPLPGGSNAIQSLVTDTVDATTNEFTHTITIQEQSQEIRSVAVFLTTPSYALALTEGNFDADVEDLADLDIGVVSLGGATENLVDYVFRTNGLDPDAARLVSIGAGSSQTAAVRGGQVDALIATEPTLTTSIDDGSIEPLIDFRDPEQIDELFGGPAPFWSLLVTPEFADQNPNTTQALVRANVRALQYMQDNSAEDIVEQVPGDIFYPDGDPALFTEILDGMLPGFTSDGLMPEGGPERIAEYLATGDPSLDVDSLDLESIYTDEYAENAGE